MVRSPFVLTALALVAFAASTSAWADRLFAVSGAGNAASILYEIDPTNGSIISTIGATGFTHVTGLAFHPTTGTLYGVVSDSGSGQLISINVTTGAGTVIGSTGAQIPDITFRSSGVLYAWVEFYGVGGDNDVLATIDLGTGAVTQIGVNNVGTFNTGLAFAPDGTLYLKPGNSLYSVNPADGTASFVTNYDPSLNNMLAFDSTGAMYSGFRNGSTLDFYSLTTSGGFTLLGTTAASAISALAFQPSAPIVPEPASMALFGLGGVGLMFVVRRRRARAASETERAS